MEAINNFFLYNLRLYIIKINKNKNYIKVLIIINQLHKL